VRSELTEDFLRCFRELPARIKSQARKNYRRWKKDSAHPGLDFKVVGKRMPIYSVRVGIGWRALGILERQTITWFWIGSHAEYDKMLKKF
jgi:hypothetical protein